MKRIVKWLIPCLVACFMVVGLVQTASFTFATTGEDPNVEIQNDDEGVSSEDDTNISKSPTNFVMPSSDSYDIDSQKKYDYVINVGETKELNNTSPWQLSFTNNDEFVSITETEEWYLGIPRYKYSITGLKVGSTTITIGRRTYDVNVVDQNVNVAVYVASYVDATKTERISDECIELLKIDRNTIDNYGYFPVGVITLKQSYINSKGSSKALITEPDDWKILLQSLGKIDTSTLENQSRNGTLIPYANNKDNVVNKYLKQAIQDVGSTGSDQRSALIRVDGGVGYSEQYNYHLDLRFETKKITFITGNNKISDGLAKDGTIVDSRTYITGSEIQEPRNLTIPAGYRLAGYYSDADFTTEWNGIGTPLNEDQTVYIKIVPKENVFIQYMVAEGEGIVTPAEEHFNPETGSPKGSTATPATNYEFDGWYSDANCSNDSLVSNDLKYVPDQPNGGWPEGANYIYYAKFVIATQDITVKKDVAGGFGNHNETFSFTYSYTVGNETIDGDFNLTDLKENGEDDSGTTLRNIPVGTVLTITETNVAGYETTATYTDSSKLSETSSGPSNIEVVGNKELESKTITVTVDKDNNLITITNTKDAVPLTGIIDNTPKGLGLIGSIVVEIAAIAFVLKKKRQLKM